MNFLLSFWRSTVGTKVVVALTGLVLFGFVIFHMAGNLQVFLGEEEFNAYGALLHSNKEILWGGRVVVFGSMGLHIVAMGRLLRMTAAARPEGYRSWQAQASTWYSRTMKVTGPIVLIFFIFHILNLTSGAEMGGFALHPDYQMAGHSPAAYHNLTTLLANPLWGVFYIIANLCLGSHLWHGAYSMCKTLGLSGDRQLRLAKLIASGLTAAVVGGNVIISLACMLKLV